MKARRFGPTEGRTNGQTEGWTNGRPGQPTDERMDGQTEKQTDCRAKMESAPGGTEDRTLFVVVQKQIGQKDNGEFLAWRDGERCV